MLGSVALIFGQVESLAGWRKEEVLILAVVGMLFHDIMEMFFIGNLERFSYFIRHGEFDFILLKPVNPRFMASFRYAEFHNIFRIIIMIFILASLLRGTGISPTIYEWAGFSAFFLVGLIVFYNIFFAVITTNFWLINLFNFNDIFDSLLSAGRYPVDIFKGRLKSFFAYVIPLGLIATFAVEALLKRVGLVSILLAIFMVVATSLLSELFWRFALKHYQSASS
jgi:ABC-2 type transport system permease protein